MNKEWITEPFAEHGMKAAVVSAVHLNELKEQMETLKQNGTFDETFYRDYFRYIDYSETERFDNARSLIAIAVPSLPVRLLFQYEGNSIETVIPPTYVYSEAERSAAVLLEKLHADNAYRFQRVRLPAKLLAVRSGLAEYGRNNICYSAEFGSFQRVLTFCSDMPIEADDWREMTLAERCGHCGACVKACPTGAIADDRFVIHAERCITYRNETEYPFPDWLDSGMHNAIIGCMKCQTVCPMNKEHRKRSTDRIVFTEDETNALLYCNDFRSLPSALSQKLEMLNMTEYANVLARNMKAVFANKKNGERT